MARKIINTQVAIVGAGPAGLLLSHLLHLLGIESVVVELRSQAYVQNRTRAGQLEPATVQLLTQAGVGTRLQAEGLSHEGVLFQYQGVQRRLDLQALTGRSVMIYGQREIVRDLISVRSLAGGTILFEVSQVKIHDLATDSPCVTFQHDHQEYAVHCDFVAGCDGFHGVCRPTMASTLTAFDCTYPFGWLGILAEAPPISREVLYSCHERGLALFSMRSPAISRYYLQCAPNEDPKLWSHDRIWSELRLRLDGRASELKEGPILEKSVVRMRSFLSEPMQHGRLFLAGDAAHIVPPSAAKGLNLAVKDVHLLAEAFERFYCRKDETPLRNYSAIALPQIWEGQRFSQWMTRVLHRVENGTAFDRRVQIAELDNLFRSEAAAKNFAESYVGSPLRQSRPGRPETADATASVPRSHFSYATATPAAPLANGAGIESNAAQ